MLSIPYTLTSGAGNDDTTTTDGPVTKRQKTSDETQQSSLASTASASVWREVQVRVCFLVIAIAHQCTGCHVLKRYII
jgi:hypothetical protein